MTMDEAREKVCPIISDSARERFCRGHKCMAWRTLSWIEKDFVGLVRQVTPLEGKCLLIKEDEGQTT